MAGIMVKRFDVPDERRKFADHGEADILKFGESAVGLGVYEPGWKWSQDVKPIVNTGSCEVEHGLYVLSGRIHVRMDDGSEEILGPGDCAWVSPGHDAWVEGDTTCRVIDFAGAKNYAQPSVTPRAEASRPELRPH
jgi:hypothetical protein